MPLLMVPYTIGTQLGVAVATPTGGAYYYARRKRFLAYMLVSLALMLVMP